MAFAALRDTVESVLQLVAFDFRCSRTLAVSRFGEYGISRSETASPPRGRERGWEAGREVMSRGRAVRGTLTLGTNEGLSSQAEATTATKRASMRPFIF